MLGGKINWLKYQLISGIPVSLEMKYLYNSYSNPTLKASFEQSFIKIKKINIKIPTGSKGIIASLKPNNYYEFIEEPNKESINTWIKLGLVDKATDSVVNQYKNIFIDEQNVLRDVSKKGNFTIYASQEHPDIQKILYG